VAAAAEGLGRRYALDGPVVRGDGRGRQLGYPTANVEVAEDRAVPADGVYAGRLVRAGGERLPAAISIGTNPTFDGTERRVEAYVLDVDLDLYGEHVLVEFEQRLRGMIKFDAVAELVDQMGKDVAETRRIVH
jgi:riboflavin kinase / FMN adenylyltransferase